MRLGIRDHRVLAAFADKRALGGHKLSTDGKRLDGHWLGGSRLAYWERGQIYTPDRGSRAADSIQKQLRRHAAPVQFADYKGKLSVSYGSRPRRDEGKWERNISTGNDILRTSANTRIIRSGSGPGQYLYRAEYWGDYSLKFPVKGPWRASLPKVRADLKTIVRRSQKLYPALPGRDSRRTRKKSRDPQHARAYVPGHPGFFVDTQRLSSGRYEYNVHRLNENRSYGSGTASSLSEVKRRAKAHLAKQGRDPNTDARLADVLRTVYTSGIREAQVQHRGAVRTAMRRGLIDAQGHITREGYALLDRSGFKRGLRDRSLSRRDPPRVVSGSKKGDLVFFEYRGFRVVGRVKRVLKDGTRTVEVTEADPGFERHMAQTIDERIMVDVRHQ